MVKPDAKDTLDDFVNFDYGTFFKSQIISGSQYDTWYDLNIKPTTQSPAGLSFLEKASAQILAKKGYDADAIKPNISKAVNHAISETYGETREKYIELMPESSPNQKAVEEACRRAGAPFGELFKRANTRNSETLLGEHLDDEFLGRSPFVRHLAWYLEAKKAGKPVPQQSMPIGAYA